MTTYTKLRNGSWGIRAEGRLQPGGTVTVTTKAGVSKTETVGKVIWTDGKITLASVRQSGSTAPRSGNGKSRGTWTGCSCGSVEEYERASDCASCQFDR